MAGVCPPNVRLPHDAAHFLKSGAELGDSVADGGGDEVAGQAGGGGGEELLEGLVDLLDDLLAARLRGDEVADTVVDGRGGLGGQCLDGIDDDLSDRVLRPLLEGGLDLLGDRVVFDVGHLRLDRRGVLAGTVGGAGREAGGPTERAAERATDWRANNNIAESIFKQMAEEPHPVPEWIVCSPGTGGTAATLGRYVSYRRHDTLIMCADPEVSVFYDGYCAALAGADWRDLACEGGSRVEGIGRPRVERSFIPTCVDAMVKVPDALSLAAMRHVSATLGRRVGGSTGTNFIGVLQAAQLMRDAGRDGSIVTILCDAGERYAHSYYDPAWYERQGIDVAAADAAIAAAVDGRGLPALPCAWLEPSPYRN